MPRTSKSRTDLLKQLEETLRKVGAQSVLLSDTVARLVGVNSTDLECLDLLEMAGPTTAGRLAEQLSVGVVQPDRAVLGLVDDRAVRRAIEVAPHLLGAGDERMLDHLHRGRAR